MNKKSKKKSAYIKNWEKKRDELLDKIKLVVHCWSEPGENNKHIYYAEGYNQAIKDLEEIKEEIKKENLKWP